MCAARPSRVRAAPAAFADEQAAAIDLARLLWAERNPVANAASSSDSSNSSDDDSMESGPEMDEERKAGDERPAAFPWRTVQQPVVRQAFLPPRARPAPPPEADTPLDFFHLFMPNDFLQSIADLTNAYAVQRQAASVVAAAAAAAAAPAAATASDAPRDWQPTTVMEIQALFGCLTYMGIVRMNSTRDYWAALTRQEFVAGCFPRDRFMALLRCLRFSEESADADDRLAKLRPLLATLENTLLRFFYPGEDVAVDEAMCGFKGRSAFKQYIPTKATRTGFKVWMLVDRATNYVCALDVFTGRKGDEKRPGAAAAVVLQLVSRLRPLSNHVVSVDNYFSSVTLFEQLLERGFYAVGTTKTNRKHFPKELPVEVEEKERGEWVWRQKQNSPLVATSWMDKKPVHFLCTCADAVHTTSVKRWIGGVRKEVPCPDVVPLYIRTMRGVDVFSQRQSYNKIGRRSRKWFFSLVWFLVDVALHNAYVLHQQKHHKQNYDEKAFRKTLMQLFVDDFCGRHKAAASNKRPRDSQHLLAHGNERGPCSLCRARVGAGGHNRRSHYSCVDCNIFLCVPNCYNRHIQALAPDSIESVDE